MPDDPAADSLGMEKGLEGPLPPPSAGAASDPDSTSVAEARPSGTVAQAPGSRPLGELGFQVYGERRVETKVYLNALPDPATLRKLTEIYPGAAKIIFDDLKAQSAHRRELERSRIEA